VKILRVTTSIYPHSEVKVAELPVGPQADRLANANFGPAYSKIGESLRSRLYQDCECSGIALQGSAFPYHD
jgi:hypothetical protein